MAWCRKPIKGTTLFDWHVLEAGLIVCTGKPPERETETTDEPPLKCLTCRKCISKGINLAFGTGPKQAITSTPSAVYLRGDW